MTKRAFIHIGSPKTGSTSIQRALQRACDRRLLENSTYLFRQGDSRIYHGQIKSVYTDYLGMSRYARFRFRNDRRYFDKRRKQYEALFRSRFRDCENLIISSEMLFRFTPEAISALKRDLLDAGFEDFLVLAYVRNPASHYLSALQQVVKGCPLVPSANTFNYNLEKCLGRWGAAFPGQLVVRSFEDFKESGVQFDCCQRIDEYLSENLLGHEDFRRGIAARENESLSAEAMHLLARYGELFYKANNNRVMQEYVLLRRALRQTNRRVAQSPPVLRESARRAVHARHIPDCRWLKRHHGIDYLHGEPADDPAPPTTPDPVPGRVTLDRVVEDCDSGRLLALADHVHRVTRGNFRLARNAPHDDFGLFSQSRLLIRLNDASRTASMLVSLASLMTRMPVLHRRLRNEHGTGARGKSARRSRFTP